MNEAINDPRSITNMIIADLKSGRSVTVRGINIKYRTNGATARLSEIAKNHPLAKRWVTNQRTKKAYKIYSMGVDSEI